MTNVLILDEDGVTSTSADITFLWRAFSSKTNNKLISVPELVEQHGFELRKNYLSFVHSIGFLLIDGKPLIDYFQLDNGLNLWWSSLISEKANWSKSPEIFTIIRILAFSKWNEINLITTLTLTTSDKVLAEVFELWCSRRNIPFSLNFTRTTSSLFAKYKPNKDLLPLPFQALIWIARHLFKRWSLRGAGLDFWKISNNKLTFVSYLFNCPPDIVTDSCFQSPYWGDLLALLDKYNISSNWLHLYISDSLLPTSSSAAKALDNINSHYSGHQVHASLDSFLSLTLVAQTLFDWFLLCLRSFGLAHKISKSIDQPELWILLKYSFSNSVRGVSAIKNCLYGRQFNAAIQYLPSSSTCFYLQENMDWESLLVQNWRLASLGTLIGVPHSSIRFWDLRYFYDPRAFLIIPFPDFVAVNGPHAKRMFLDSGYREEQLVEVEALRYLYLSSYTFSDLPSAETSSGPIRLLVLGDYLYKNNNLILNLLGSLSTDVLRNLTITLKPHPACSINPLSFPRLNIKCTSDPLPELLSNSDIALTSSLTTAALDAYCFGLPVISIVDPIEFNLSPLRGYTDVYFVSTSSELELVFKRHSTFLAKDVSDIFYLNPHMPMWTKLILKFV